MSLYSPPRFVETDLSTIGEVIAAAPFATLISNADGQTLISHVPVIQAPDGWLISHVATANPHSAALTDGAEVLAIFHGPHTYVSPAWYAEPSVPTWNYVVVHVKGRVHVQTGDAAQALLDSLTSAFDDPAQPGHKTHAERAHLLKLIHCFRIEPLQVDAKFKLSQNKPQADRQRIITELGQREDENSQAIASLMLRQLATGR